jgi:hypothetical protein
LDVLTALEVRQEPTDRPIARIATILVAEFGDDLLAVWLYGSRIRG